MTNNKLIKLLCSIPVILVVLYFLPFLGVCLIISRYIINKDQKYFSLPITLVIGGLILLIPKALDSLKIKGIPYLSKVLSSDIYPKLITYSKRIITIGIIFLILSYIFKSVANKLGEKLQNYIKKEEQTDYEIRQKNDLVMQEKREKAKNTHIVKCPHCGAKNTLTEPTGTCNHCRMPIS